MSEFLNFEEDDHYEGKTKRIVIVSKRHINILGEIKWHGAWRQYCFYPEDNTIWNKQCLNDVNNYINSLMNERKK